MRILFPLQETLVKNLPKTSSGSIDWVATYQAVRESNCSSLKRFYHLHSAKFLRARISLWDFYKGIRLAKSTLAEDTETSSPGQDDKRTVRVARLPTKIGAGIAKAGPRSPQPEIERGAAPTPVRVTLPCGSVIEFMSSEPESFAANMIEQMRRSS